MQVAQELKARFARTRALTESLTQGLSDADSTVQAMADASPAKWHLAHTTWFFETFVLKVHVDAYRVFDERYHFLFNSYYEAEGPRLERPSRGFLTRPGLDEVRRYRRHVTDRVLNRFDHLPAHALQVLELGCHHEEQHQELIQTDILYLFSQNPLAPAAWPQAKTGDDKAAAGFEWTAGKDGLQEIGHGGEGFCFDCETPRHKVWLAPHALGSRLVTNAEWRQFLTDGGYQTPGLWLSDGWTWVRQNAIEAPLYWREEQGEWSLQFTLAGLVPLDADAPVRHVSFYEAEAFARWSGARLPTEAEWEVAAAGADAVTTSRLEEPAPASSRAMSDRPGLEQMFGQAWQWTASAFLPYPGFQPAKGAIGEYNGKFMSGQFVLRGGSRATPPGHSRPTYLNFFYPHQRWQFTGVRLARDA